MAYAENARKWHQELISRVEQTPAEQVKHALLYILGYMDDIGRFVPGAHLYDSYIRELIDQGMSDHSAVHGGGRNN